MKKQQLKINRNFLDSVAKNRFAQISKQAELWDDIYDKVKDKLEPRCQYVIFDDIKIEGNILHIGDQQIEENYFSTIPKEIIGQAAMYVLTIGDIADENESVLNSTLIDMIGTAYIDAMRDLLRMEFQEEDYLVSGSVAPGLEGMALSEISKFDAVLDFASLAINLNDSFVMVPEKSAAGLYFFFNEEHPVSTNSCATCMARGHGCNFCSVKGE